MGEFKNWLRDYLRKTRADLSGFLVLPSERLGYEERVDWYLMKLSREWTRLSEETQKRVATDAGLSPIQKLAKAAVLRDREYPRFIATLRTSAETQLDRAALARALYYFRHRVCMFASGAEAARTLREQREYWQSLQSKAEVREAHKYLGIRTPLWQRIAPFA